LAFDYTNKLIVDESFYETLNDLKELNLRLPPNPIFFDLNYENYFFPPTGNLVDFIEKIKSYDLNAENGEKKLDSNILYSGYDESIQKYSSLEGTAYLTSHSLLIATPDKYLPINYITFYFYTRSLKISKDSNFIKYVNDIERESNRGFLLDKINFLRNHTPQKSILFIDGPLIGGDLYTYMIHAINEFLNLDIIPIFFVKNSDSNLVVEGIREFNSEFNSDLHWANVLLKKGQRSNFFKYTDINNLSNAKVFCYLKCLDLPPQRVEFHVETFKKHRSSINDLMDMVYYLLLVQGNYKNLQLRPIAIAEKYARETLKSLNIINILNETGLMPVFNQIRFGGN
jgi:hypothetical protein